VSDREGRGGVEEAVQQEAGVAFETGQTITNWSNTHSCSPARLFEPTNAQDVLRVLEAHHAKGRRVRAVGTGLSPNGIGLSSADGNSFNHVDRVDSDLVSVAALDHISIDAKRGLVTVGAGTRVSQVLKALAERGLTLENFSSIQEQQMGGWTQVAAHGTGCSLPTVDEMVVRMKLATPTEGLITLSDTSNPHLFRMARVGLGALGVVTELTMRTIPQHRLREYTYCTSEELVDQRHYRKLRHFRHVRYMWIPYTGRVCVVASNPTNLHTSASASTPVSVGVSTPAPVFGTASASASASASISTAAAAAAVLAAQTYGQDLELERGVALTVQKLKTQADLEGLPATFELSKLLLDLSPDLSPAHIKSMGFSQLRAMLLDIAPSSLAHVQQVNAAEAAYWEACAGTREAGSVEVLGFDCGGEQWVLEVCLPIGTLDDRSGKDIQFVRKLLRLIERHKIPAPAPIEQRWSARSTSPMSPAYSPNADEVFTWVGVIMYLPQGAKERAEVKRRFGEYKEVLRPLMEEYGAQCHWAKLEMPSNSASTATPTGGKGDGLGAEAQAQELQYWRSHLAKKYPIEEFRRYRDALDPRRILSNDLLAAVFDDPKP